MSQSTGTEDWQAGTMSFFCGFSVYLERSSRFIQNEPPWLIRSVIHLRYLQPAEKWWLIMLSPLSEPTSLPMRLIQVIMLEWKAQWFPGWRLAPWYMPGWTGRGWAVSSVQERPNSHDTSETNGAQAAQVQSLETLVFWVTMSGASKPSTGSLFYCKEHQQQLKQAYK